MPKISKQFTIAAPAPAVWAVIGLGFASIGDWATAIPASTPAPPDDAVPVRAIASLVKQAPVAGRVCRTGLRIVPTVTETLVAYDDERRSLTYEASGMPSFVTVARNTWTVTSLGDDRSLVTLDAQFDTRGLLGALARWLLTIQLGRTSQYLGDDLRHFVEYCVPSPRKQRQLNRVRSL